MAYSKKVVDKFENTIKEPEKFNVGRFDPKELNVGTGMVGAPEQPVASRFSSTASITIFILIWLGQQENS